MRTKHKVSEIIEQLNSFIEHSGKEIGLLRKRIFILESPYKYNIGDNIGDYIITERDCTNYKEGNYKYYKLYNKKLQEYLKVQYAYEKNYEVKEDNIEKLIIKR